MKKIILKIELHDDSIKRKVMKGVSGLPGVESVSMNMKDKKLTIIGDIDSESIVGKLRTLCRTEIVSVEEEKEDKKKEKEEEKKKDEKEEEKKEEKKEDEKDQLADLVKAYQNYYQDQIKPEYYYPRHPTYYARSMEEDPKGCVIC